jgi:hypothetical protein
MCCSASAYSDCLRIVPAKGGLGQLVIIKFAKRQNFSLPKRTFAAGGEFKVTIAALDRPNFMKISL